MVDIESKYYIETCSSPDVWDDFVDSSPQGSIFCKTSFISSLKVDCCYYFVKKGNEIIAAIPVLLDKDGSIIRSPYHFTSYMGIMFSSFHYNSNHKKITREFEITSYIINSIISIHGSFSATLSPAFNDIRPFLWYNYHEPNKGIFKVSVRYTPILSLNFNSKDEYISSIRNLRRRELKRNMEFTIQESANIELLDELHFKTFERQNIIRTEIEQQLLTSITREALNNKYGRLTICYYKEEPASAYLFLMDNKRAYYLFGANHPNMRETSCSTELMIENIFHFKNNYNMNEIDFVGANSPNRGDYKISFNAELKAYYELHFNI